MANVQKTATLRRVQLGMSFAYSSMGAWCLFHPSSVIGLSLAPPYAIINRTTSLLMRCFGAQAMTCGLLLGTAVMTRQSFTLFGIAMVPYLGFNAWFGVGPGRGVFTKWLWLDCIGNMAFAVGSLFCAKLAGEIEDSTTDAKRA